MNFSQCGYTFRKFFLKIRLGHLRTTAVLWRLLSVLTVHFSQEWNQMKTKRKTSLLVCFLLPSQFLSFSAKTIMISSRSLRKQALQSLFRMAPLWIRMYILRFSLSFVYVMSRTVSCCLLLFQGISQKRKK